MNIFWDGKIKRFCLEVINLASLYYIQIEYTTIVYKKLKKKLKTIDSRLYWLLIISNTITYFYGFQKQVMEPHIDRDKQTQTIMQIKQ